MDQVDDEELLQLIELRVRELLNKYEYDSHPPPLVPPSPSPPHPRHASTQGAPHVVALRRESTLPCVLTGVSASNQKKRRQRLLSDDEKDDEQPEERGGEVASDAAKEDVEEEKLRQMRLEKTKEECRYPEDQIPPRTNSKSK
jgi:hypothetical protein